MRKKLQRGLKRRALRNDARREIVDGYGEDEMRTAKQVAVERQAELDAEINKVKERATKFAPSAEALARGVVPCLVKSANEYRAGKIEVWPVAEVEIELPQWFVFSHLLASKYLTGLITKTSKRAFLFEGSAVVRYSEECLRCGRAIVNPISMLVGYGPVCSDYLGIPRDGFTEEQIEQIKRDSIGHSHIEMWIPADVAKIAYMRKNGEPRHAPAAEYDIRVEIKDGILEVTGDTYQYREDFKSIPGARWANYRKSWTFPISATAAERIREMLAVRAKDKRIFYSDDVTELVDTAALISLAQAYKTKDQSELAPIPNTKTPAWKHQLQTFWFAHHLPAAMLALDMGTGKSKIVVDLIVNRNHRKSLILCPLSVVPVWPKQFANHAGWGEDEYTVFRLDGFGSSEMKVEKAKRAIRIAEASGKAIVLIANYELGRTANFSHWALQEDWDLVVLDESHKVKAPGGTTSKFVGELGRKAKYRLALTGTPMPHSPFDVYGQYRFLDPGIFGTNFAGFRNRYAQMGGYGGYEVTSYRNEDELNKRFYSIANRVTKDVLDLPEVMHVERITRLAPEAEAVYKKIERQFYAEIAEDKRITVANVLVKLLRLSQISNGHVISDEGEVIGFDSAKQNLFAEILDELPEREPVVVFTRFHEDLNQIRNATIAAGRTYSELSGRTKQVERWQAGETDVLGAQIQSGGVGIDLTRARYAVYWSTGLSLGDYEQSLARVHRPGQSQSVVYVHMICANTVDEKIYAALAAKKDVVEYVLGLNAAGKSGISEWLGK